jgi:DnaJ-class molecular chaperone
MRCQKCQGSGEVNAQYTVKHPETNAQWARYTVQPCPDCMGSGVAHCCDGLTACPEISDD